MSEKSDRVAVILVNYNMPERANQIVNYLHENTEQPYDLILVDNGSDLINKSAHTTLSLAKNVQTTNGWLMGLHYADALEHNYGYKYFAYVFSITSIEMVDNEKDVLAELVKTLKLDPTVAGVTPALTADSTTAWKHLKTDKTGKKSEISFMDNLFGCYRASWFNQIGRFNPTLTYAWGVDIETGHFARKGGHKIVIDDSLKIKKVSNIGYTMKRMNMTASDRTINAGKQMNGYFYRTYGHNFEVILEKRNSVKTPYLLME
jgi:hypothetical protein